MTIPSIPLVHKKLHDIYHSILSKDEESLFHSQKTDSNDMNEIRFDETVFDFGIKYRIISTDYIIAIHIKIIGWDVVKDDALSSLIENVGTDCVISETDLHNQVYPLNAVAADFNVTLIFRDSPAQNIQISLLTHIRNQILGSRLSRLFRSIDETHSANIENNRETEVFCIPIQRNFKISGKNHIFKIIVSYRIDRVTVVVPMPFPDETDRAFAKLFLQQLQQEQRNSAGKNAPLCTYRRSSEPPVEFLEYDGHEKDEEEEKKRKVLAGYCSLTFLKINVDTEEKRQKAAENVLMFYDLVDCYVKKMKLVLNAKLRQKHSEMLHRINQLDKNDMKR
jgi:hypothetical protein